MEKKEKTLTDNQRYERDRASVMSMLKFILIVAILIGACYVGKIVVIILLPFLIGFLISKTAVLIGRPFSKLFGKDASKIKPGHKKSAHTKVSIVVYVILNIIVVFLIVLTLIGLVYQANNLVITLAELTKTFKPAEMINTQILERLSIENGGFLTPSMIASLKENIINMGQTIVKNIPTILSSAASSVGKLLGNLPYAVFFVISILLSGFYFINDGPAVMKFFVKNTPNKKFRNRVFTLLNELSVTVFRVLGGYLTLFVITTIESFFVFWFAGLNEYALVLSIITGLIDFLPILGVSATMIPMMIYQFMHGNYISVIVLIVGLILMSIIRRFLEPAVLGKSLKMHPLITLIAMAAGVYIWGAAGFLIGPVLAILIIQVIRVFEIDKMVGRYFSGILDRFMKDKGAGEEDSEKEDSEKESDENSEPEPAQVASEEPSAK